MISSVTWFTDKSSQRLRLDRIALQFYKIIIIPLQGGFPTNIRPSAAIRQNYNEITALFRSTQPPIYPAKNGEGDPVVTDIGSFVRRKNACPAGAVAQRG